MTKLLNETNEPQELNDISGQAVDFNAPGVAKLISKRILTAIDDYCATAYDGGHRKHLGASLIGHDCKRYLWYLFRWCGRMKPDGRKQRLFNRGHREEARFIEWLEGIGFKIWFENREGFALDEATGRYFISSDYGSMVHEERSISETDPEYLMHVGRAKLQGLEFPQYRISDCGGHFGGSLDGIAAFPPDWNIPGYVLLEFKTNGTGKSFDSLLETGMAVSKPQHFGQTSTYGVDPKYNFTHVLYLNICKNDDNLHVELVKLDWNLGKQLRQKANQIITSQVPLPKLSLDRTYWLCKGCDMFAVCHEKAPAEVNCRSCSFAVPIDGGKWKCTLPAHADYPPLPDEIIAVGCPSHADITLNDNV